MCMQFHIHILNKVLIGLIYISKRGLDEEITRPWVTQEWILKGMTKGMLVNMSRGNDFVKSISRIDE